MKVHLRSVAESIPGVADHHLFPVRRLRELALLDRFGVYSLTDDPTEAGMIIFVESAGWDSPSGRYLQGVTKDPICRRFREKTFVHSGQDWPVPFVPGIFPSIEKSWKWIGRATSGSYIALPNPYLATFQSMAANARRRHLASFVGCCGDSPLRNRLVRLDDKSLYLADNSQAFVTALRRGDGPEVDRLKREFVEIAAQSKYILCPRGFGASSFRLFEAMEMGRAPVIVSDQWTPPPGPDWDQFIIRVREADVGRLGEILKQYDADFESRGTKARAAWDLWFGPEVLFHRICDHCHQMMAARRLPEWSTRWLCYLHLLRPGHARHLWRQWKSSGKERRAFRSGTSEPPTK